MDYKPAHFQKGMIILWYGPVVLIPTGWQLCDGSNSTPDLRNNFVLGAGDTYAPGATGGTVTHYHSGTLDGHAHDIEADGELAAGAGFATLTSFVAESFQSDLSGTLPPYYALAWIMKL